MVVVVAKTQTVMMALAAPQTAVNRENVNINPIRVVMMITHAQLATIATPMVKASAATQLI